MRSVQTEASTHDQSLASAPCVALAGTVDALSCLIPSVPHPPSCPAFPRRGFALRASRGSPPLQYYAGSDPCRASPARQVSPFHPLAFRASNPQPRRASERHVPITSCARSVPCGSSASPSTRELATTRRRIGFVILQATRSLPAAPHPASGRRYDRIPRTTQLLSATCAVTAHGMDSHHADKTDSRTHEGRRPAAPSQAPPS